MTRFLIFLLIVPAVIVAGMISTGHFLNFPTNLEQDTQTWSHHIPHNNGGTIPDIVDLSISKTGSADLAFINTPLTYTLVITNNSTLPAIDIIVTDSLPSNADFKAAVPAQGLCNGSRIITCGFGNLASGQTVTATIVVTPTIGLSLTNVAQVSSFYIADPDPANNTATETTQIVPGPVPAPPDDFRIYLPLITKKITVP